MGSAVVFDLETGYVTAHHRVGVPQSRLVGVSEALFNPDLSGITLQDIDWWLVENVVAAPDQLTTGDVRMLTRQEHDQKTLSRTDADLTTTIDSAVALPDVRDLGSVVTRTMMDMVWRLINEGGLTIMLEDGATQITTRAEFDAWVHELSRQSAGSGRGGGRPR